MIDLINFVYCLTKILHLRNIQYVASSQAQKVGIIRKCLNIYDPHFILPNCFFSFFLPLFEYCAPVWRSASENQLKLLNKSFNMIKFLLHELWVDLFHRLLVESLSFLKIFTTLSIVEFPSLPLLSVILDKQLIKMIIMVDRCSTGHFYPYSVRVRNSLSNKVVNSSNIDIFK